MSIQATNIFHTKPGRAAELLETLQRVLPETLAHGGCEEIRLCRDQDDENKVSVLMHGLSPPVGPRKTTTSHTNISISLDRSHDSTLYIRKLSASRDRAVLTVMAHRFSPV